MSKARWSGLLGGVVAALALAQPGRAETPAATPSAPPAKAREHVLIVGVGEYADKQIKARPRAEKDAADLYKLFSDKARLAAEAKDVTLLLGNPPANGGTAKATKANFLKALRNIAETAGPDDLVLIAFIGQGGPLGDSGDRRCYFLADSTVKGRDKDAAAAEDVEEALKKLKASHVAAFLDVDFTGFEAEKATAATEPTLGKAPYREFLGDDGTDEHGSKPGRVAFLATNGLSTSLDLKENGLFSAVLLEGLKGKADEMGYREGYEADGLVTVDELAKFFNKRLPELARVEGKTSKEKEQDHYVIAGPSTRYVLAKNPEASEKSRKTLEKFEALVADKKLADAAQVEEGRAYLTRMPPLKQRQELRKVYQAFAEGKLTAKELTAKRADVLAAMRLKDADAAEFADKVLEVTRVIEEEYVKEVEPGKMVVWAISELYKFLEEKVPAEVAAKLKKAESMSPDQLKELLVEARTALGKREDLDSLKDLTVALQRMLHKLDPHTTFIDPDSKEAFDKEVRGNFTGIGIQIRKDAASDELLVVTPIKGSPAYKAGIQAGDIITHVVRKVDSKGNELPQVETTPTLGMNVNKAVKLILGEAGTPVGLKVRREGEKEPLSFEIVRGRVEVESIVGFRRKANAEWDYMVDPESKIGYVRMSSFAHSTYGDLVRAIRDMQRQGVKGLVFDLRFNPGGLLSSAVQVTDLFIDDGLVVSIRPRAGQAHEHRHYGHSAGSLLDLPLVCLVNGYSASGSEIVSAALQDHSRARIFGERSYGKGSVQNIRDFKVKDPATGKTRDAEIKLTNATFWRPNGKNLNKLSTSGKDEDTWGVTPDKVIPLKSKERRDLAEYQRNSETIEPKGRPSKAKEFKDRQLDEALSYLRGQIKLAARAAE